MTTHTPPLETLEVTQNYGDNRETYKALGQLGHNGTDYQASEGTEVYAAAAGYIIHADWGVDHPWLTHHAGISVLIDHGDTITGYAHLSDVTVDAGQKVAAGELIGHTGATGTVTGPHLHFEILNNPPEFNNGYAGRVPPPDFTTDEEPPPAPKPRARKTTTKGK